MRRILGRGILEYLRRPADPITAQKPLQNNTAKAKIEIWEDAASAFMALLMIMLGIIMIGDILLFRRIPGEEYFLASLYTLIFAIVFNASNPIRERFIPRRINSAVSLFVNLAIITLLMNFTGGLKSEFYIAYFLIPTIAALCFGLKGMLIALALVFFSLFWFFIKEPYQPLLGEQLLFRILLLILVSVPFLLLVEREKKYRRSLETSYRELEQALSELKQTQAELVHSAKLAALGRLGAGIAHELDQPLASIGLYAQMILSRLERDSSLREDLSIINEQTDRMRQIVKSLKNLSRQSKLQRIPVDVTKPIEDALRLLLREFKIHNIRVIEDFNDNLPEIAADEDQLQQVFLNILSNAQDAFHAVEGKDKEVKIQVKPANNGQLVEITVADNGCGIPEEVKDKILDPFFSTKSSQGGLGLGLSITSRIIRNHDGSLNITSQEGKGTIVKIVLPSAKP